MNEPLIFTLVALLLVLSPGPNSVLILKTVASKGEGASMQNIIGLVTATFVHGAVSILGLSAIILQSATAFTTIKLLGAAYLVYLGVRTIIGTFHRHPDVESLEGSSKPKTKKAHINFVEGFLTQLLNPKVSMFYLAAFPQFLDFSQPNYSAAFLLVSIHAAIIFCWFTGITMFITQLKKLRKAGAFGRWFQRFSGSALIYFGGVLVTQEAYIES